jgi:hypothetical protein
MLRVPTHLDKQLPRETKRIHIAGGRGRAGRGGGNRAKSREPREPRAERRAGGEQREQREQSIDNVLTHLDKQLLKETKCTHIAREKAGR